jgi:hypothetical protein
MAVEMKVIFVGGTGRCGKSIVAECLAQHPDAFKLPFELRFLTDPDGIVDFYTSSLSSWSPFLADRRLKRLGRLLRTIGASPDYSFHKYTGWQLSEYIPTWYQRVDQLMQRLYEFCYECDWVGSEGDGKMYHAGPTNREDLTCILSTFVRAVIKDLLEINNKSIFISDDTWSVLFAKELTELLPEAKFIHVYRDPRDVVSSMSRQRWCPSDLEQAARYYLDIFEAAFKNSDISCSQRLEDFIEHPSLMLKSLCYVLDLKFNKAMLEPLDRDRANIGRWRDEPEQEWVELVIPMVKRLGYE